MSLGLGLGLMGSDAAGGGGSSPTTFDNLLSGVVADWDVTQSGGLHGATLKNLIASPSDGSSQTDYDLTNNGFTLSGSAGTSGASLVSDGNDNLRISANPTFLADLHKTNGSDFTYAIAFKHKTSGVNQYSFGTSNSIVNKGVAVRINATSNVPQLFQEATSAFINADATGVFADATDSILIVSVSRSSNLVRFWVNTNTNEEIAQAFEVGTSTAIGLFTIAAETDDGNAMPSGGEVRASLLLNEFIGDAEAAIITSQYNLRHGDIYTIS